MTAELPPTAELLGKVRQVLPDRKTFHVWTENAKEIFICLSKEKVYYHSGDAIISFVHMDAQRQLHIVGLPFVQTGKDHDSVINAIRMGLGLGTRGYNQAYAIFEALRSKWSLKDPVEIADKLDRYSIDWRRGQRYPIMNELTPTISTRKLSKCLQWWYKRRVLRQLYLMGLTNKDIRHAYMDELELYQRCLTQPYTIVNLSMDKCHQIMSRTRLTVTETECRTAVISRSVYNDLMKNGWIGTPVSMLDNRYKDLAAHLPSLQKDYNFMIDQATIYLPFPHQVEEIVGQELTRIASQPVHPPYSLSFIRRNLTTEQKEAIKGALTYPLSIITGCAGSGKTTIIREIVSNLDRIKASYMVTSFTGKAVCRLREVLSRDDPATMDHFIVAGRAKPPEYLIIDEVSMVTSHLLYRFGRRFGWKYNMILIEDVNQLPQIGWGNRESWSNQELLSN